jgi:uncharacterized protein
MNSTGGQALLAVPLFPLPNVVLFPRAVLPLHIFEERYKEMMADALDGDKQIAMALLRPGWEKNYYAAPSIEPVVCVGEILSWERLADGKYNLLLQGRARARVVREWRHNPYRMAELRALEEIPASESDLEEDRIRLRKMLEKVPLGALPSAEQFLELIKGTVGTEVIADLVAGNYLEDIAVKQGLLSEVEVGRRVRRTVDALHEWIRTVSPLAFLADPRAN